MIDVRSYPNGSFRFGFTPAIAAGFAYNGHANIDINDAATQKMLA